MRAVSAAVAAAAVAMALAAPAAASPPDLNARAWALIDARSGDLIASHAARRRLPIASATKLMTAYVTLRRLPRRRIVRAAPYSPMYGESLLGLRAGQRISVRDLLYGLILRSGNDAAVTLARAVAGSERRFVRQMNLYASALGLPDTHYANPVGLDERGNHSSAYDLAILGRRLLRFPFFRRLADSPAATLRSLRPARRIETLNNLLLRVPWATGIKTGHTFGADYVLVSSARRNGVELVSAVLGAPTETDRDLQTLRLLDYGFSRYRQRVPVRRGRDLAAPDIEHAGGTLPLVPARTVAIGLRRDQRLRVDVRAPREVEGPIRRGTRLGRAIVLVDGRRAARVPLLASRSIPRANLFDRARSFVGERGIWLAGAAFVILMGAVGLWRRRRRRADPNGMQASREHRRYIREQQRRENEESLRG